MTAEDTARRIVNAFYARKAAADLPEDHAWLQREIVKALAAASRARAGARA